VSNGSLGVISGFKRVRFEGQDAGGMSLSALRNRDALELAYAITIHKAQGSGFSHVFVVIPERYGLLTRELMYTALSRARESVTLFVQVDDERKGAARLLDHIRRRSAIEGRRSSVLHSDALQYADIPEADVKVKSRVEYIIFKKLREIAALVGGFAFAYEQVYPLPGRTFELHPDFTIRLASGETVYWEHLGGLGSAAYVRDWDERRAIYEANGDGPRLLTTDERRGISDVKIEALIEALVAGSVPSEDASDRYSRRHVSLR